MTYIDVHDDEAERVVGTSAARFDNVRMHGHHTAATLLHGLARFVGDRDELLLVLGDRVHGIFHLLTGLKVAQLAHTKIIGKMAQT
jgi:hypothetical protein